LLPLLRSNLILLLASGDVVGETRKVLGQYGYLEAGNKLHYKIPYRYGWIDEGKPFD
jgi:hypothetical protein